MSTTMNPIIALYRSAEFDEKRETLPPVALFDTVNSIAWARAGSPDDGAGSAWAEHENQALRVIEREYERNKPTGLEAWAREIAQSLASDKSNDWSEELDSLADILQDEELRLTR